MAKKINVAIVKEFLFNHGEKVALGTCAFLAVFFGVMGLVRAMGAGRPDTSGKTWSDVFKVEQERINASLVKAEAPVISTNVKDKINPKFYVWDPMKSEYVSLPYAHQGEPNTSKRINPRVLPIEAHPIQLDYIPALVYVHEVKRNALTVLKPKNELVEKVLPVKGKKDLPPPVNLYPPVKEGVATRMVVVTAVFPMRKQVEEFQQALRMSSQREMFTTQQEDRPRPLGINVLKFEIVNKKRVSDQGEILIYVQGKSKDKKMMKGKTLDDLLKIAFYDETTPGPMANYIWAGLTTPWPRLGNAQYPKFKYDGFEIEYPEEEMRKTEAADWVKPPMAVEAPGVGKRRPMPPIDGMKEGIKPIRGEMDETPMKAADVRIAYPLLAARLFPLEPKNDEKPISPYNIFHVLGYEVPSMKKDGEKRDREKMQMPNNVNPMGPGFRPKREANPDEFFAPWDLNPPKQEGVETVPTEVKKGEVPPVVTLAYPKWDRDALVRFIDPGVVPGKTYEYEIQVRMANPNYGKEAADIAFAELARSEELLPSDWVTTPQISIPHEYHLYAIDQQSADDAVAVVDPKKKEPKLDPAAFRELIKENIKLKDHTWFQVHQFIEDARDLEANGTKLVVGDWAVAERELVRLGDTIGTQALVKVPVWKRKLDAFEMRTHTEPVGTGKKKAGFKMDFRPENERPILIDFTGGKRFKFDNRTVDEESAVDALVMSSDGKLIVLNSRIAMEGVDEATAAEALLRQERVLHARRAAMYATPPVTIPPVTKVGPKGTN